MPGPPPKAEGERRRRNAAPSMVQLPAEGRKGDPPAWPLSGRHTNAEKEIWAELWKTPQAVAWEKQGIGVVRTVARYSRMLVEAEKPNAKSTLAGEVRQLEDRLGLTPMSMLRLRWEIVADEVSGAREEKTPSSKRRGLRAVDPPDALARS